MAKARRKAGEGSEATTTQLETSSGNSIAQGDREGTREGVTQEANVGADVGTNAGTNAEADRANSGTPPPIDNPDSTQVRGDVAASEEPVAAGSDDASAELVAISREGETRSQCWERLRKQARLAGLPRGQGPGTAYAWATTEADRIFQRKPPPEPEPVAAEPPPLEHEMSTIVDIEPPSAPIAPAAADLGVSGLGELPEAWPTLPANAQLQVEIAWVSANRLRVRSGHGVDLSRALSPAPSYSALSWLETSILFPSKFADISVKATAQQDDEKEVVRREKMAIEEIRALLAEMLEG